MLDPARRNQAERRNGEAPINEVTAERRAIEHERGDRRSWKQRRDLFHGAFTTPSGCEPVVSQAHIIMLRVD